jgi:hypothetical protein
MTIPFFEPIVFLPNVNFSKATLDQNSFSIQIHTNVAIFYSFSSSNNSLRSKKKQVVPMGDL